MLQIVNNEMFWVVTEICSETNLIKRMKLIKAFIKIASKCVAEPSRNWFFLIRRLIRKDMKTVYNHAFSLAVSVAVAKVAS